MDIAYLIKSLKENDLRKKIIIPSLQALKVHKVEDWHGRNENGKDVYFSYPDPFGDYKHCCCFIKAGNITKNGKTDIRKMEGSIKEAFFTSFVNPLDNKTCAKIEEVWILCNGKINNDARNYIKETHASSRPNLKFIDGDKLVVTIMQRIINPYNEKNNVEVAYIFNIDTYPAFCRMIS